MEEKYVTKFENGNVMIEIYSKDGKTHREDGPAHIRYYENGNKNYEMWMRFGKYYREDGPAVIKYEENGDILSEEFFENGEICRIRRGNGHIITL